MYPFGRTGVVCACGCWGCVVVCRSSEGHILVDAGLEIFHSVIQLALAEYSMPSLSIASSLAKRCCNSRRIVDCP